MVTRQYGWHSCLLTILLEHGWHPLLVFHQDPHEDQHKREA
ncbi:MAG TPA: hypothetical protein VGE11_04270 [Pseudonocardia sp.]